MKCQRQEVLLVLPGSTNKYWELYHGLKNQQSQVYIQFRLFNWTECQNEI